MSSRSLASRFDEIESATDGPKRYADVAIALTRDKDGSTLLYAGGRWDRVERRFVDHDPDEVCVIPLEESQVPFTRWFAGELRDFRDGFPREVALALAAGARRGGKTFDTYFCQICALVDVPLLRDGMPAIGWTISRTYRERDELDQLVLNYLPKPYYRHQKAPEHRFVFPHGSYLRNLSADEPDSLKQGRVDWLLYNEPQKMSPVAIKNGMYGTADRGGLTILAANPPSDLRAEWLIELKESIDDDPEIRPIARFFNFDVKKNTKVDQPARRRVAKLAHKISPDGGASDDEGTWGRWGDMAYPAWNGRPFEKGGMVWTLGPGVIDVTRQVTRRELGGEFDHVIGGDFQRRPQAAAVIRVLEVPGTVGYVYYFCDEQGTKGTEVELSTDLLGEPHSYRQKPGEDRSAVWVGDCSGSYQGAERVPGRTSFGLLEGEGWVVYPAEVVRIDGKAEHPKNPDVGQRLKLVQRLMGGADPKTGEDRPRRLRVAPGCVWLREAFAKCELRKTETGRMVPKGKWAHVTDGAGYALWRLEPRPGKIWEPAKLAAQVRIVIPPPSRRGFL